jgi:hypothetical protein
MPETERRAQLEAAARAKQKRPRRNRPKETAPQVPSPPDGDDPSALHKLCAALAALDRRNGLKDKHKVIGAYRLGSHESAAFGLVLKNGTEITLGNADKVLNQPRKIKAAIAAEIGVTLTLPSRTEDWDELYEHLHACADVRDVTLSRREESSEWISSYLPGRTRSGKINTTNPESLALVIRDEEPFRSTDDRLYLRLAPFVRFITLDIGQRTTQHDVSERLGTLGFRRRQLSARVDDYGSARTYVAKARFWASPQGFDPDDDPTSPSVSLTDQTDSTVGTWGRGDKPVDKEIPQGEQRGHVGTLDHQTPQAVSVKGDHRAGSA